MKNTTVTILDLRSNDAWDVDWVLVRHTLAYSTNAEEILYYDKCGDPVYFSGEDFEAQDYYNRYCLKHKLMLENYDTMALQEMHELELKRGPLV